MTVADLSVISAEVRVDETDIVNVKLGQPAEVTLDAIPNKTFHGTVSEIGDNALVRSTGVAQTIRETAAGAVRANSVAVYEARFKRSQTFGIRAPIILEGDPVVPAKSTNMFGGNSFSIDGGAYPYGIGTIDTNTSNTSYPDAEVKANLDPKYYDQITGSCCASTGGAVGDITGTLTGDQLLLKDPAYLWNFIYNVIPKFADSVFQGDQQWSGSGVPPLGTPQSPRLTYVNGDLAMGGGVSGTGVLVVNGELKGNGKNDWTGLILVIGKGVANMSGMQLEESNAVRCAVSVMEAEPCLIACRGVAPLILLPGRKRGWV